MLIVEKKKYPTNYLRAIEWFEEYLSDVVLMTELIEKYPNDLFYCHKKDGIVLKYDIKSKLFYMKNDKILKILESKFGLNLLEINKLTKFIFEQHTKRKIVTTFNLSSISSSLFEQHTKRKVVTTFKKYSPLIFSFYF